MGRVSFTKRVANDGLFRTPAITIHAVVDRDEFGRFDEPDITCVVGGRVSENDSIVACGLEVVRRELERRADLIDQVRDSYNEDDDHA